MYDTGELFQQIKNKSDKKHLQEAYSEDRTKDEDGELYGWEQGTPFQNCNKGHCTLRLGGKRPTDWK
jgi:hypothetical protein